VSCSCRNGKRISSIESKEIEEFLKFLRKNPKAFSVLAEVVNSFRPTDSQKVRSERVFLAVRDSLELGVLSYRDTEVILKILKGFFSKSDKERGDFLEVLVSKLGPFTFNGRYRRINQCRVYKGKKKLSEKEIDVAFSGKETLELHECKANMVRQWRDPLSKRSKRGSKLHFLNDLPKECENGKKVVTFVTGLDGRSGCEYVRLVLRFYGFKRVKVLGREELKAKLL
jgi:hypothetical protein